MNNPIGTPFITLHTVDSTNNYAMGLVHEGLAHHGTAVFAHHQTRGKGQRNREWLSAAGENIAITIVIEPVHLLTSQFFLLSKYIAVITHQFVMNYLGDEVFIKWPNDIFWRDRKTGGILIENVLHGTKWKYAIAGIGLNINQTHFPGLIHKAVSFKEVTGKNLEPLVLAKKLCDELEKTWSDFMEEQDSIALKYRSYLYKLDEPVRLKKDNRVFEGVIKDVTMRGELVVKTGIEERFSVGEVEWVL